MPEQDRLLAAFERHLLCERALAASTAAAYAARACRFLASLAGDGLASLTAGHVTRAVLAETEAVSAGSAQYFVAALRAFLRFCFPALLAGYRSPFGGQIYIPGRTWTPKQARQAAAREGRGSPRPSTTPTRPPTSKPRRCGSWTSPPAGDPAPDRPGHRPAACRALRRAGQPGDRHDTHRSHHRRADRTHRRRPIAYIDATAVVVFTYQQPNGTYVIDIHTRDDTASARLCLLLDGQRANQDP